MVSYLDIIELVVHEGKYKNQLLYLENVVVEGVLRFERDRRYEKYINIDIDKKIAYIKKTYHSGTITKKNPCIEKIEGNTIYFRAARLFPTLYIDLIVISELFKYEKVTLVFKKLFIGYHILGLQRIIAFSSKNFNLCFNHWQKRFANEVFKLEMLNKYRKFLENTK